MRIHLVSFDNPSPPNYGGVIDVYYKIRTLHKLGVNIVLHAFAYGRPIRDDLNDYCEAVHYYKRRKLVNPFGPEPYIVASRYNSQLLGRLSADNDPILFEGLHTCGYLNHPLLRNKVRVVRMHNVEHEYYHKLEQSETGWLRKLFFKRESVKLRKFEPVLSHASAIAAISENDTKYFRQHFQPVFHITAFHPNDEVSALPGRGDYAFYHGKLSVAENDEAACFLVDQVFRHVRIPLHIAGDHPSENLKKLVRQFSHIHLHTELDTIAISEMTRQAHVNVIPTFQATGIKLKLINVLYQGRFILANSPMVQNTGCETLCTIADTPDTFIEALNMLFGKTFTSDEISYRAKALRSRFDNLNTGMKLMQLFSELS